MNLIILSKFAEAWDSPHDILSYQKTKISIEGIITVSRPVYFYSHSNIKVLVFQTMFYIFKFYIYIKEQRNYELWEH